MNRDARQVLTEWLVLQAQNGDEAAFRQLHDLWSADVVRFAAVRVQRPVAADEVANDAWLAVARGLRQLDDPACFPRWLFQIVTRRSADWVRTQARDRNRQQVAAQEADQLAPAAAPPATTEQPESVVALRAATTALPPEQQQLLHLYYELQRSVREIAEILAVPEGTIKSPNRASMPSVPPSNPNWRDNIMNDIDRQIQAALQRETGSAPRAQDPSLAEEALATFRGRHRWLHGVAALFTFALFGLAVWSAFRFYGSEAIRDHLLWGGVALWALMAVGLLKIWFWLEMHTNRVLREVKRVELLLHVSRK
jgi:RNA polymerase sigma factor (sigma-70 family)